MIYVYQTSYSRIRPHRVIHRNVLTLNKSGDKDLPWKIAHDILLHH